MRMMLAGVLGVALVTAPLRAQAEPTGRAAKIASAVMWIAAGVATAVGVAGFVEYNAYEKRAHEDLATLAFGDYTNANRNFFNSPTCSPPASLYMQNAAGTLHYVSDCNTGSSWANATTAMLVLAPALAVGGIVTYTVGAKQAERRERERLRAELLPTGLKLTF